MLINHRTSTETACLFQLMEQKENNYRNGKYIVKIKENKTMTVKTMNIPFEAETIYNGKVLRRECYYTESQWMNHVEKHALKILKRYVKRKVNSLIRKACPVVVSVVATSIVLLMISFVGYIASLL